MLKIDALFHDDAPGALPNGTRIVKCNSTPGDTHPDGHPGTVYSSMASPEELKKERPDVDYGYFVIWDGFPYPVMVMSNRIKPMGKERSSGHQQ